MIILRPIAEAQSFNIIPRSYFMDVMTIKDEMSGQMFTYNIEPQLISYYAVITQALELVEGNFYKLTVFNNGSVVYRDKIFCTAQDVDTYSLNKDEYVEKSSDNDFIIFE